MTGKHDYRSTHDDEVFLGAGTVCDILVASAFKMPWFNHEPDMISPESFQFCINQDFIANKRPHILVKSLTVSEVLSGGQLEYILLNFKG